MNYRDDVVKKYVYTYVFIVVCRLVFCTNMFVVFRCNLQEVNAAEGKEREKTRRQNLCRFLNTHHHHVCL